MNLNFRGTTFNQIYLYLSTQATLLRLQVPPRE